MNSSLIRDTANTPDEDSDGQEIDPLLLISSIPTTHAPFLPSFMRTHRHRRSSDGRQSHRGQSGPAEEKGGQDSFFQSRIMTNRHPRFLHLFNILAACLILLFCVAVGNLCKTMMAEGKQGIKSWPWYTSVTLESER